jgi:hypothetical protein
MSHRRDRWYTITQRPLSTGAIKRVYIVACSKCGRQGEQHASQMTDDMRRKWFQREGWEIGKWKNLHVCPTCAGHAPAPITEVEEPEPVLPEPAQPKSWLADLPKLQQAWNLTYEDEHLAFIEWLRVTYGDRYIPAPAPPAEPRMAPLTLLQTWEQASSDERSELWRHFQTEGAKYNLALVPITIEPSPPPLIEQPAPEPVTEAAPADDYDGAEDWYVQLMEKRKQKKPERTRR